MVLALGTMLQGTVARGQGALVKEDFENGMAAWHALSDEHASVIVEPGTSNHILELIPHDGAFSHVILERDVGADVRVEGRFQFPTEGDGYLGFIYNFVATSGRTDFGCLYVKSNGSYVRVSPHYDGNPSWRLYEELKVPLEGERRIRTGHWHDFRLDVHRSAAALYIDEMSEPVQRFDHAPNSSGHIGLEARPGFGEPVWVDDVIVSRLVAAPDLEARPSTARAARLSNWRFLPAAAMPVAPEAGNPVTDLPTDGWRDLPPDYRGALITGALVQYRSGTASDVWLRASFAASDDAPPVWLAFSSANRLDVWANGDYRGSIGPEAYIWRDFLDNPQHAGARLSVYPKSGNNDVLIHVNGNRFAGGGFFAEVVSP